MTARPGITSIWIIISLATSIISFVILYMLYIVLMPGVVLTSNNLVGMFGAQFPQLNNMAGNVNYDLNADFIIVPIGIFIFMLIVPYIKEFLASGTSEVY